jgi:peptide/nickel transport system substrate-binding protein
MRIRWPLAGVLAILVASLTSTIGGTWAAASANAAKIDRSAEFHHAINFSYFSLDPHKSFASAPWLRPLYDRLLQYAPGQGGAPELAPMLAKSYKVSADGLAISFELRDDVKFQDGNAFNAAAVKANIERAKSPSPTSLVASNLASISSVEVIDNTHVVLHLSVPDPAIPHWMADSSTGSMISPAAFNTDLVAKPVGTGPFTMVSSQKDGDSVYERWDGYWNKKAIKIKRLTISTIVDPNVRYNGVRGGTFDSAYIAPPLDLEAKTLTKQGYHWAQAYQVSNYGVMLNSDKPPLNDVRVRQAISMAINRKLLASTILEGIGTPVYQTFNKGEIGYVKELDKDPYDQAAARKLVKDASAEGATLTGLYALGATGDTLAQAIQQALTDVGLKVQLTPQTAAQVRQTFRTGSHHIYIDGMAARPDPSATLLQAYLSLDNPAKPPAELVDLANKAKTAPFGSEARNKAYQDVSRYLAENPVHVPINRSWWVILAQPEVKGAKNLALADWNGAEIEFQKVGVAAKR